MLLYDIERDNDVFSMKFAMHCDIADKGVGAGGVAMTASRTGNNIPGSTTRNCRRQTQPAFERQR